MNGNCIDIGSIQAFLDGETVPEMSLKVSRHIAGCDDCAALLARAEEENSLVFSVLDRELNTLVPTQRLWSRINESIAVEKSRITAWQRLMSFVTANLASPSFAVAAGMLIVFGIAAVSSLRMNNGNTFVIGSLQAKFSTESEVGNQGSLPFTNSAQTNLSTTQVGATNLNSDELRKLVTNANYRDSKREEIRPQHAVIDRSPEPQYLPGEESYIKTISDLEQNTQSNPGVRASSQIAYQRDLAVVDDAITKMKQVVRKNPRNQAAKQVLYSSYQDKIDLLNSVAQREELMASLSSQ